MVSALRKLTRKPKSVKIDGRMVKMKKVDWKGPGKYYHRGGKHAKFSKYNKTRDLHETEVTRKPNLARKWDHIHDAHVVYRKGKRVGKL